LKRWVPVVVWAAFISWFSSDAFSARSTHSYIDPILRFFFPDLTREGFRFAHSIIRKSAHFIEYAVLAVLICRALAADGGRLARRTIVRTIGYCAAYAMLDELHQALVPSRTGSAVDVMIDAIGATFGTLSLAAWRARRARDRISDRFRARASDPSGDAPRR
jgi:VanZ family protein